MKSVLCYQACKLLHAGKASLIVRNGRDLTGFPWKSFVCRFFTLVDAEFIFSMLLM